MREHSAFVYEGPAETMPGELWTLYTSDGTERTFLLDSTLEASLFARHFGVKMAFDAPPELDPRRALDYQNIRECMYLPVPGAAAMEQTDGLRYASAPQSGTLFDGLSEGDKSISFGGA